MNSSISKEWVLLYLESLNFRLPSIKSMSIDKSITVYGESHMLCNIEFTHTPLSLSGIWSGKGQTVFEQNLKIPESYIEHFIREKRNIKLNKILENNDKRRKNRHIQ
jgi:YbbR domain-containing protein